MHKRKYLEEWLSRSEEARKVYISPSICLRVYLIILVANIDELSAPQSENQW